MRTGSVVALFVTVLLIADAPSMVESQEPGAVPTCLRLTLGAWDTTSGGWVGAQFHTVPEVVRLDTVVRKGGFGSGSFVLYPPMHTGTRDVAFWKRTATNGFALTWTNGFTGVGIQLDARGDSLVGYAEARSDGRDPRGGQPTANTVALRVPCPDSLKK